MFPAYFRIYGLTHDPVHTSERADIDNAVAQPAIRTYLYAFARRHIFNDTSASVVGILAGTTTVSGIVDYTGR